MNRSSDYYQPPTTMWDSRYDDPFLENDAPVFPDENIIYFCHNCSTEVGAYLREDYQPVCDTCFGEFLELRESNNSPATSSSATATRQSTTTPRNNNNNTSSYLSVPPRQDSQRDREQRQPNSGFQETQPGISFRLYNNASTSSNNNNRDTDYHSNSDWLQSLSTPSISTSPPPPPPPLVIPETNNITSRRSNGRKKWWQVFSKRRSSSSIAQPTSANDGHGDTRVVNGRLSQFTSSLVRIKRPGNASSTSFTSYRTDENIAGGSSSAIETTQSSLWQDDEEESCAICSEDLYSPSMPAVKLSCQHVFHRSCVSHWLERDTTCPYCRRITHLRDAEPVTRPPK